MSRNAVPHPEAVIEWSPRGVAVLDPTSRTVRRFDTPQQAAGLIGAQTVLVAVSRRAMFVRTMRVPNASQSEIETIVKLKLPDLFPLPPTDLAYVVDTTSDVTAEGRLAIVVAMSATELRRLHEDLKQAGFRVQQVVPIAYGSLVLASTLGLDSCAVVSRDEAGVGIDILQEGTLRYARVAPLNSSVASEVCRTYSVVGIPCGDIVASEGMLVDEADVVSAISPLEALSGAWPSHVPHIELPEVVIRRSQQLHARSLRLSLFMLAAGIVLAAYAYMDYANRRTVADIAKADITASVSKLQKIKDDVDVRAAASATISSSLKRGFEPAQTMSEVMILATNSAPADVWLNGITLERGKQLLIRGTAKNAAAISAYVDSLNAQTGKVVGAVGSTAPRLRDVKLSTMSSGKIDETEVLQFGISAFPVGNLPLIDPNKKVTKK
jgi:hypothetical protein